MRKNRKNNNTYAEFDETDKTIIQHLQENGRRADTEIAHLLGISHDTVKRRRERLEMTGLIKIRALIDPKKLGFVHLLHLAVTVKPTVDRKVFAEKMSREKNVYYAALPLGPGQHVLVHFRAKTKEELYEFVESVRGDGDVEGVDVNVIFDVIKAGYHSVSLETG